MSKDILDMKRLPINKTAALVVGKGIDWTPNKKILTADSDFPLTIRSMIGENPQAIHMVQTLVGKRCGRLTILGLSNDYKGKWVVRCQCGTFTLRNKKVLTNPENMKIDCCENCRHLLYIKRAEHFRRTGKEITWSDL